MRQAVVNVLHRSCELVLPLAACAALLGLVSIVPMHVWQRLRPGAAPGAHRDLSTAEAPIRRLHVAPDGSRIAGLQGTEIVLLDPVTGVLTGRCSLPGTQAVAVAWGQNGRSLLVGYGDGTVALWKPAPSGSGPWTAATLGIAAGGVSGCALAPDLDLVAASDYAGCLTVWALSTGRRLWRHVAPGSDIRCPAFTPDGRTLLAGFEDGTIRAWDSRTGALLAEFRGHRAHVLALCVAPDGRRFASGGHDGTVRLWDLSQPVPLWTCQVDSTHVSCVAFSPDGASIVAGGIPFVSVLETASGQVTGVLEGHERPICDLVFLPDRRTLFTASFDGRAVFWDYETGLERRRL